MKTLILAFLIACTGLVVNAQTADEFFDSKQYSKALNLYHKILEEEPQNVKVIRRIAFIYYNSENMSLLAQPWFERALEIDPKDVASNYYLGVMYKESLSQKLTADQRKQAIEKAKKYLNIAADLGSEDAIAELKVL
jgi:tetratricopeptide (TPR) repeat protein